MRLPQEHNIHRGDFLPYLSERSVDYSEYMWMADEMEEFDRKCLEELMEDEFIEDCFEEMHAEEDQLYEFMDTLKELTNGEDLDHADLEFIVEFLQSLPFMAEIDLNTNNIVGVLTRDTKLNPDAPEFIPREMRSSRHTSRHSRANSDLDSSHEER